MKSHRAISRRFSSYTSPYMQQLKTFNQQFNLKQTVADKRNLQRFLETQVKDGKLRSTIQRTTQYDTEFSKFLKEYQQKNRESPNILDLSRYARDHESFNKDFEQRKEELLMLEEFRKRRKETMRAAGSLGLSSQSKLYEEFDEEDDMFEEDGEELGPENDDKDETQEEASWDPSKRLGNYIFNKEEFIIVMLAQDTTTLVTKLNRINHFRSLIFAGNGNGVIGYGKGKGNDFDESMKAAEVNLKKNLIVVPLDHFCPLVKPITASYNGFELRLFPRTKGMNPWGSPMIAHLLLLTGITNVRFKCIFRNMNPYAMIYTYFKAVTQLRTPKELCESEGKKIYRQHWGKPAVLSKAHTPESLL